MRPVELDQNGIYIEGKATTLLVSSFFYFRIPEVKWRPRLKLLKAAGYNAIDVYFPWNFHELEPGEWCFEGQRNIEAFLRIVKEEGLYIVARPGPYICSEWDGGAIPPWLYAKGIPVRQDEASFLDELYQWYDKVIPLLAAHQLGSGGNVILLQIENELDYFTCHSPATYMHKLARKVRGYGIEIPLFYCCGQNDMSRAGYPLKDALPSFNIYSDDQSPYVEERALHLGRMAQSTGGPLMVSETNRTHSYLKRLLACGAKLLSPYNQTAGTTMEYYNGTANWGPPEDPMAFMATDYDFDSMIRSDGSVTEEYYRARLFAGLLHTFGEKLALAHPVETERGTVVLQMAQGALHPLSNLGSEDTCLVAEAGGEAFEVQLPAGHTALLPVGIPLEPFGGKGTLLYSSYEIAFAGDGKLILYGQGRWMAAVSVGDEVRRLRMHATGPDAPIELAGLQVWLVSEREAARMDLPCLPPLPQGLGTPVPVCTLVQLDACEVDLKAETACHAPIDFMEKNGLYRGLASYGVEVPEPCDLLLHDVADLIDIRHEGAFVGYRYSPGATLRLAAEAGHYTFTTEIWGHSNFDDLRLPALHMGSMKGLRKITRVQQGIVLGGHWQFRLQNLDLSKAPDRHYHPLGTIMELDHYNRGIAPLSCSYTKLVELPEGCDSFTLHFSKADCVVNVYVGDHFAGTVCKADPYVDISRFTTGGALADITLHTFRRYHSEAVGEVTLLCGTKIATGQFGRVKLETPQLQGEWAPRALPLAMEAGKNMLLRFSLPAQKADARLVCRGKNMKLTFTRDSFVLARILLENEHMPAMRGGDSSVVYIPGQWLAEGPIDVVCQAIGEGALLEPLGYSMVPWVFE